VSGKTKLIIFSVLAGVLVLYLLGSAKQREKTPAPTGNSTQCRVAVTADVLNLRAAPDPTAQIVATYHRDQEVDAEKSVRNGFRQLGENKWAALDYLRTVPGRDCG